MGSPRLLVAISSHGFGHVAQVAPVINELRARQPELQIILRTAAPAPLLAARIRGPVELQPVADDFGMVQRSALAIDLEASAARYREFHAHWPQRVAAVAAELSAARPDLILADVPYLTLAAAARAGIPAVALCSLHWADIYRHYCGERAEAPTILEQMTAAYESARWFLRPTPAMPMHGLTHTRAIGPLANLGLNRRAEITARTGVPVTDQLVLVTLGGIATRLPAERWPRLPGVRWIFQRDWQVQRDDALVLEDLGMTFSDVLASVDLLFTKPGYGSFVEATAAGVPVLYLERADWPETACLAAWLHGKGRAVALAAAQGESGDFASALVSLLQDGRFAPPPMTGVAEAADLLQPFVGDDR